MTTLSMSLIGNYGFRNIRIDGMLDIIRVRLSLS